MISLLLASSLTVMAAATLGPALPQIEQAFAGTPHVGLLTRLVLTVTAIFIVIGSPLAGMIVDRYGRKHLLLIALLLYALAGTSGLYLDSLPMLLVGRAVLGLTVACVLTASTTLIADLYAGPERAKALGRQSAFLGAGGVVLLLLGGSLAEIGWRLPFSVYFASLAVFALVWWFVPEPSRVSSSKGDTQDAKWPVGMVTLIMLLVFISQAAFYLWPAQLPFYLAQRFDAGGAAAGLAVAVSSGTGALASFFYRHVRARLSDLAVVALAYGLMGTANLLLSQAGSYPAVLAVMIVGGAGVGLMFPTASNWMTNTVPEALLGRSVGLVSASIFSGHFISPFISQPVMERVGFARGYELFSYGLMALSLVVLIAAVTGGRRALVQS
ncbi:MAG: MFS transporter [Pseudomonadota bacterium]